MTANPNELGKYKTILETAVAAAQAAAEVLAAGAAKILSEKSAGNLVTQADLDSETTIVQTIRRRFPDHLIHAEESSATADLHAPAVWIIDPLDGTNNYAHGIPQYSVSIAYAEHGAAQVGVVYDPCRDEMFTAVGGEAKLNEKRIAVSQRPSIDQSIICTGFYYDRGEMMRKTLASIDRLFTGGVRGVRRFGSAALDLCWVACGRLDGYFEYQLAAWDLAAGSFIVRAAGGQCSDRAGADLRLDSASAIASNGLIHKVLLERVRWRPENELI